MQLHTFSRDGEGVFIPTMGSILCHGRTSTHKHRGTIWAIHVKEYIDCNGASFLSAGRRRLISDWGNGFRTYVAQVNRFVDGLVNFSYQQASNYAFSQSMKRELEGNAHLITLDQVQS
jgi:hypothetical protein